MALHKDLQGNIHDDMGGTALHLLPVGCIPITQTEAIALRAPTAAQLWTAYQSAAQAELDASDLTYIRCGKAGVAFPAAWQTYVLQLRAIVAAPFGIPGALPIKPAYPAGT